MPPDAGSNGDATVLVTGATGAVGGRVAARLVAAGRPVAALVRAGSNTERLLGLGVRLVEGDITDPAAVRRAVAGVAYIVHAAALLPGSRSTADEFQRVNAGGTRNVLEAAMSAGVRRLAHVSTVNVMRTSPGRVVDETAPPPERPHPGYDSSKLLAEQAVMDHAGKGLDAVVVNPAIVFGPGSLNSSRMISAFVRGRLPFVPLPGRRLCLVYVDDAAAGCIAALDRGVAGERYILSNPPVTVADFMEELAGVTGRRKPRLSAPDSVVAFCVGVAWALSPVTRWRPPVTVKGITSGGTVFDGGRAVRQLGVAYTPLSVSLAETVAWIRETRR